MRSPQGGLGEWFNPAVLKTADRQRSVSSNLTASARSLRRIDVTGDNLGQQGLVHRAFLGRLCGLAEPGHLFVELAPDAFDDLARTDQLEPLAE